MDINTEEILQGEQEVTRRLNAIRNSKKVQGFMTDIKEDVENTGMSVKFKSRIKENKSAINKYRKYIDQYGESDPEMWDSCGMMVIVEDVDEIYEFVKYFEDNLTTREGGILDYVKNPKAGYRSIHMYSIFEAEEITVPVEVQIKTEAMSIAQDTVHDSIYKLEELPYEKRNELSTALFPIFEKSADADKFEKRGDLEEAAKLRSEVEETRKLNSQLLLENQEVINDVWKEYGKVIFNHHNMDQIEGMLFMQNPNMTKEDKEKASQQISQSLDKLFEYYIENSNNDIQVPSISGNPQIDYAIYKLGRMDYSELVQQIKMLDEIKEKTQKQEQVADAKDFEKLDAEVSPEMRKSMMSELSREMSERNADKDIDTEQK